MITAGPVRNIYGGRQVGGAVLTAVHFGGGVKSC